MKKKVLICDDTMLMRKMLREILSKNGYEIVGEAENGKVAVEKYNELKPDIVLMDITMPELNGIMALKGIMMMDSQAKVIMCSAMGHEEFVLEAIKNGAKDFIVKPFENKRVLEALGRVL